MNILLVTPFRLTASGGVSVAVRALSREFTRKTHVVNVLLPGESKRIVRENNDEGAPIFSVYLRGPHIRDASLRALISFLLFLPFTLVNLHRFLKQQKTDVVFIQYPLPGVVYFAILRWFASWKLVITYQGSDVHDLPLWTRRERGCIWLLLGSSDCIVAVSRSLLRKLLAMFPALRQKRSHVIHNGASLDLLFQGSPPGVQGQLPGDYVLTVGHLIHRKGMDVLMRALRLAFDHGQTMNLVVVGDGPERQNLFQLVSELKISNYVHFLGDQPQKIVLEILKDCLFFVLASRAEGLPLVIAEAMACGKAVVSTNVDGVPEIVLEDCTGVLVDPDDERALEEALLKVYRDAKLREKFGGEGKKRAYKCFTWATIATQYLDLFNLLRSTTSLNNHVQLKV